jgi:hypothetical protein
MVTRLRRETRLVGHDLKVHPVQLADFAGLHNAAHLDDRGIHPVGQRQHERSLGLVRLPHQRFEVSQPDARGLFGKHMAACR